MRAKLKVTPPRVRPRGRLELHAYLTEEALAIEESLLILPTPGIGSDGRERTVAVHIPQPFTFLLMKLHAFADRMTDPKADLGQHHALDLYRIVAMLTEADFGQVRTQVGRHDGSPPVNRARDIVRTHFASPQSTGSLRLREHPFFTNQMAVQQFLGALSDLFR